MEANGGAPAGPLPIGQMITGTVKVWYEDRGFGFLVPTTGGVDVFVHRSVLTDGNMLEQGAQITFEVSWNATKGKYHCTKCVGAVGSGPPGLPGAVPTAAGSIEGQGLITKGGHEPSPNLFVAGLPREISEDAVRQIFSGYGMVQQCKVLPDSGRMDRAALVRMSDIDQAQWIVANLHGNIPQGLGAAITVRFADNRAEKAKALGIPKGDGKGGLAGGHRASPYGAGGAGGLDFNSLSHLLIPGQQMPHQGGGGGNNQSPMPGDWFCPNCNDLQFAKNHACRKCGTPNPNHAGPGTDQNAFAALMHGQQLQGQQLGGLTAQAPLPIANTASGFGNPLMGAPGANVGVGNAGGGLDMSNYLQFASNGAGGPPGAQANNPQAGYAGNVDASLASLLGQNVPGTSGATPGVAAQGGADFSLMGQNVGQMQSHMQSSQQPSGGTAPQPGAPADYSHLLGMGGVQHGGGTSMPQQQFTPQPHMFEQAPQVTQEVAHVAQQQHAG